MEKTRRHDESDSSNIKLKINVSLSESCDNPNGMTDNVTNVSKISFRKGKKKQKITKKNVKRLQIDIEFNLQRNEPCALHFVNERRESTRNTNNNFRKNAITSTNNQIGKATCQPANGKNNTNINNNLQEDTITTANNQIDEAIFQPANEKDNSNVSEQFPYIKNASSIGSEDAKYEKYEEDTYIHNCPDIFRDLNKPYYSREYDSYMMKHILIDTFALNVHHILRDINLSTMPYCFSCLKVFRVKSKPSVIAQLIRHIRNCVSSSLLDCRLKDQKKSKGEKQFSLAQLALEYITVPHDELKKRFGDRYEYYVNIYGWLPRHRKRQIDDEIIINFYQPYTCLLCCVGNHIEYTEFETEIDGCYESLHKHITSNAHQDFKGKLEADEEVQKIMAELHASFCLKKVERCRCELCNYENSSEMNFIKHLQYDAAHATRLADIPESERENFNNYYCHACLLRWFGHKKTYKRHDDQDDHKDRMPYYPFIEHMPKDCLDLLKYVKQNRQMLVTESNLALQNTGATNLLHSLKRDLIEIFPNIRVYPFGSRKCGLALPDSDLDVFLDCDYNTYGGKITSARSKEILKIIENELSLKKEWRIEKVILNCRTPIIRIIHIASNLSSDITVSSGLGVEKTKMIKCFNKAFPVCRELILYLKQWLRNFNRFLGSNFITSYALAWCVIFYLQNEKIFPSISRLIELKNQSWRISGWETGVSYDFPVGQTDRTFEELLFGFFTFYSEFNYNYEIICPLLGQALDKSTFSKRIYMKELTPYVNYIKRPKDRYTEEKPKRFTVTALSVQDPFDLSHNITKGMNERKLKIFQTACKFATRYFKHTLTGISSKTIKKYHVDWHKNEHVEDEEDVEDENSN